MNAKDEFSKFIGNLVVSNSEDILISYKGVTKKCNQTYYDSESDSDNSLQVGSYGRQTAMNGISDLDMVFEMPISFYEHFNSYEGNGQYALLKEVRETLKERYPSSDIRVDGHDLPPII